MPAIVGNGVWFLFFFVNIDGLFAFYHEGSAYF